MLKKKFIKHIQQSWKDAFKEKKRCRYIAFFLFLGFLIFFFPAFHTSGLIVFGDIDFGFTTENYFSRVFPLWNDLWSSTNFFNSTRIFFVGIPEMLSPLFGNNSAIYQKIIIGTFLQLSFFSMFVLVWQILHFETKRKKIYIPYYFIFIISFIAGLFYAINPWTIMRIQHIYLLAGYAILPLIFYKILYFSEYEKVYKKPLAFQHIIMAAILYIVGMGSVHYIVFMIMFIGSWYACMSIRMFLKKQYRTFFIFQVSHILLGVILLGLLMYWFIPYLGALLVDSSAPKNLNTIETIDMFSRFSDIRNILYLTSYWWPLIDFKSLGISYWIGGAIVICTIFCINLSNKRDKYSLFFLSWAFVLLILSGGTQGILGGFYAQLVFDNPLGSAMGSIFRDPNKFVGLLAFCYSVLWALGVAIMTSRLALLRKKMIKENIKLKKIGGKKVLRVRSRNIFLKNAVYMFMIFFIGLSVISHGFYIAPFKKLYIDNFYASVEIPAAYRYLINFQKDDSSPYKYMYLPRYEHTVSPGHDFAIATWNQHPTHPAKKPTGAIDIASTVKPTYQPLEGSNVFVGYMYSYIDHYIAQGLGENLGKYLKLLGVGKLVYHNDIVGLEEYQGNQLKNLEQQKYMHKQESFDFMHIFSVQEPMPYSYVFPNNVFIFGGLKKVETLFNFDIFPFENFSHIFVDQDKSVTRWHDYEKDNDIVNVGNKDDLFMSLVSPDDILAPFSQNKNYDPFFRWSAMRVDIPDFRWHLKNMNIKNWAWDFDHEQGIVFTYAPSSLEIESDKDIFELGEDLIDFSKVKDISEVFHSNSEYLKLSLSKKQPIEPRSAIKGKVLRGQDQKTWRIGEMEPLDAKENHPYTFELSLSGVGVSQLHGKVKFYNEDFEEIGVDYVVAPRYIENFELIKFRGSFVTPPGTHKIVLQVSSLQKPNEETYWWLHDIKFRDLGEYKKENTLSMKHYFKVPGDYQVFIRKFNNIQGGAVQLDIAGEKFYSKTKNTSINRFQWENLGDIHINKAGENTITLKNVFGFNAVNMIVFIPESEKKHLEILYESGKLFNGNQIISGEGEKDFEIHGNIQSDRTQIYLSNGKSVNLREGYIEKEFYIFKEDHYTIDLRGNPDTKNSGYMILHLFKDGKELLSTRFSPPTGEFHIPLGKIGIGKYHIKIDISDTSTSLVTTQQIEQLAPEYHDWEQPDDEPGCSYYEGLLRRESSYQYQSQDDTKAISLNRGLSCFWLVSSHNFFIPVVPDEQFLISYTSRKKDTKKYHSKIKFFDKNGQFLDKNVYFYDHWLDKDRKKYDIEKIITTPKDAHFMRFEFLQKQRQEPDIVSEIEISDFQIRRYRDMPGIDAIMIYDTDLKTQYSTPGFSPDYVSKGKMEKVFYTKDGSENKVMQVAQSFTKLWQMEQNGERSTPIISNFFLAGYILNDNLPKATTLEFLPKKMMYIGYSIFFMTLLFAGVLYFTTKYLHIEKWLPSIKDKKPQKPKVLEKQLVIQKHINLILKKK